MMRGSRSFVALLLVCADASGCSKDDTPPNAPLGELTGTRNTPQPDAGQAGGASDDAGAADGSVDAGAPASACLRVPTLSTSVEDATGETSTEQPADFLVTRQAELWSADCDTPRLTIALSDGFCPVGLGHELSLSFSVNDIQDGAIHLGNNAVASELESDAIRARYTRPKRLKPSGVWGTCAAASGQIVFFEAPVLTAGSLFQARYQLNLTPCDGSDADPEFVVGTFKIRLSHSLAASCPDRSE
jgi:hypothetical protein